MLSVLVKSELSSHNDLSAANCFSKSSSVMAAALELSPSLPLPAAGASAN